MLIQTLTMIKISAFLHSFIQNARRKRFLLMTKFFLELNFQKLQIKTKIIIIIISEKERDILKERQFTIGYIDRKTD